MPYYPTFVFFDKEPETIDIIHSMLSQLGNKLPEIGFEIEDFSGARTFSFSGKKEALNFLKQRPGHVSRFWMAGDFDSIEFESLKGNYWSIEFWDFDSEIYDTEGLTVEMKESKKQLAVQIHSLLIENNGVIFSYTSSADDSYCGTESHSETAEMISEALNREDFIGIADILKRPLYFWLVGTREQSPLIGIVKKELKKRLAEVVKRPGLIIFEDEENLPFFLLED